MICWLSRAAMISAEAATPPTDKTDDSARQLDELGLLSVVAGPILAPSQRTDGLVSVLSVLLPEPFEESPPFLTGEWYSRGWVWSERETQTFLVRKARIRALGLSDPLADKLADRLVARDRDGDDRRLCVECRHCRPGPCCTKQFAVLDVLQRCDYFASTKS